MIIAGFGIRASASLDGLRVLLADRHVDALAIVADKADHPALVALAREIGKILLVVPIYELKPAQTSASYQPARYGKTSLAEATALAAAGPGAVLILPRIIAADGRATLALAEGKTT